MSPQVSCPAHNCEYTGSITEVLTHFDATGDSSHTWVQVDYRSETAFKTTAHDTLQNDWRKAATHAEDAGDYETAVQSLEQALEHAQHAGACAGGTDTRFAETARDLLEEIERVEQAAVNQQIDTHLTTATTHQDEGDAAHIRNQKRAAERAYAQAERALNSAAEIAAKTVPERQSEIAARQDHLQLRVKSLQVADTHRQVSRTLNTARDHRDRGDSAFKNSDYQSALEAYEKAIVAYHDVESALTAFKFETATPPKNRCDLCQEVFGTELIQIDLPAYGTRSVCPACTHFAADGVLPTPRDIQNERTPVEENIAHLKSGEYRLDWSTQPTTPTSKPETAKSDTLDISDRELLMDLIQVYQATDGPLTASVVEQHTTHGIDRYRSRFGGLDEALQMAGLKD